MSTQPSRTRVTVTVLMVAAVAAIGIGVAVPTVLPTEALMSAVTGSSGKGYLAAVDITGSLQAITAGGLTLCIGRAFSERCGRLPGGSGPAPGPRTRRALSVGCRVIGAIGVAAGLLTMSSFVYLAATRDDPVVPIWILGLTGGIVSPKEAALSSTVWSLGFSLVCLGGSMILYCFMPDES